MSTNVYVYKYLYTYKCLEMYLSPENRDSRLFGSFVVSRVNSEDHNKRLFSWSPETSLPTKILNQNVRCSRTLQNIPTSVFHQFIYLRVLLPLCSPLCPRLSTRVSTLLNSLFCLSHDNLILGVMFYLYLLGYDYIYLPTYFFIYPLIYLQGTIS